MTQSRLQSMTEFSNRNEIQKTLLKSLKISTTPNVVLIFNNPSDV